MSYVYMSGTRQKKSIIIIITINKQLLSVPVTQSVMHYARNGYFNKIIEPSVN